MIPDTAILCIKSILLYVANTYVNLICNAYTRMFCYSSTNLFLNSMNDLIFSYNTIIQKVVHIYEIKQY